MRLHKRSLKTKFSQAELSNSVYNITRSTKIAEDLKIARNWWDKSVGLLSKNNPRSLLFYTRFGIHTFGLKLPIDILILNKQNKVVDLKENCLPNHFFFWNLRYNKVVELPLGSIRKSQTQVGDQLKIK